MTNQTAPPPCLPWETISRNLRTQPNPTESEQIVAQLNQTALVPQTGQMQPWLPWGDETAQEYFAFRLWLEQSPRPKIPNGRVPKDRGWVARSLAYDEWLETQPQTTEAGAQQIAQTLVATLQMASHLFKAELGKHLLLAANSSIPTTSLPELIKAIETAGKLSRLLTGQSTENVGLGRWDLAKYTDDELADLDRLAKKGLQGG